MSDDQFKKKAQTLEYAEDMVEEDSKKFFLPSYMKLAKNKFTYTRTSEAYVTFRPNNHYLALIFDAIFGSTLTEWFVRLTKQSQLSYLDQARDLFRWLDNFKYEINENSQYLIFKDYEVYSLNQRKLKTSPLSILNNMLKEGVSNLKLSLQEKSYLYTLAKLSKPTYLEQKKTSTVLNDWFDLPWLRDLLGEQAYLSLESPKQLLLSFRITIAVTLLKLGKSMKTWRSYPEIEFDTTPSNWHYKWNRLLLLKYASLDNSGAPQDPVTELFFLDLVKPLPMAQMAELRNRLSWSPTSLPKKIQRKGKSFIPWQKPILFIPQSQTIVSEIEQTLAAWLIACEAVQPTDIFKLRKSNYTIERNQNGGLLALQNSYFKGRSDKIYSPGILSGSLVWAKALESYLSNFEENEKIFFITFSKTRRAMPNLGENAAYHNVITFLLGLWQLPRIRNEIEYELRKYKASSIFLDAILALQEGSPSYSSCHQRNKMGTFEQYKKTFTRPLPLELFTCTHIKNMAVYAESDIYRDDDLINHHSHTSQTEKLHYLTDKNKDYVNRLGRITRVILNDLLNVIYNPLNNEFYAIVHELNLRTQVTEITGVQNVTLNHLDQPLKHAFSSNYILVSDTEENGIYLHHFLAEAERIYPSLLKVRPDWVENNLLPQVEWAHQTLLKMKHSCSSENKYNEIKHVLPQLFDHLLETIL